MKVSEEKRGKVTQTVGDQLSPTHFLRAETHTCVCGKEKKPH